MSAASDFKLPSNNRSQWINKKNKTIYLDAYNANPSSMKSSLESFAQNISEKGIDLDNVTFILGDMNELGDQSEKMHADISKQLLDLGAVNVVFVGNYAKYYANAFTSSCEVYTDKEDLIKNWPTILDNSEYLFIKASRSLQLESLIDIT